MISKLVGATIATFISAQAVSAALTSTLYVADGDNKHLFIATGSTYTTINTTAGNEEYAIAVASTVRAFSAYSAPAGGTEYTLAGVPTGTTYTNTYGSQFLEGTTDGTTYNYALQYYSGDVVRFDRNWASPTVIFSTGGTISTQSYGITYQPSDHTLWTLENTTHTLSKWTLGGTLLSTATLSSSSSYGGLALNPTDGTLWTYDRNNSAFVQFSTAGTQLQTVAFSYSGNKNIFGLEFAIAPEPALLSALVLPIAGFARRPTKRA